VLWDCYGNIKFSVDVKKDGPFAEPAFYIKKTVPLKSRTVLEQFMKIYAYA